MSFLTEYKQRLDQKSTPAPVAAPVKTHQMHRALAAVVTERKRLESKLQDLIIERFGWDAAATPGECQDIWKAAPLQEMSDAAAGRAGEGEWAGRNKKAPIQNPASNELVIMQGGMGKIVDVDPATGNIIVRNQQGEEKGFARNQLVGPKLVNNKRAWALKTAMVPRG